MLSSYMAMQNAVLMNNMAAMNLMGASDRMLNSVNVCNSQPLRPSFSSSAINDELLIKANETRITVAQKLIEALEKKLGKDAKKSVPNYAGLDYKA